MPKSNDHQRLAALTAQQGLRDAAIPLVLVVAGVEAAGRHEVLNALTHCLDTRGLRINAWTPEQAPGQDRPTFWRFWQHLPVRGQIGLFLDGWYADPILAALRGGEVDVSAQQAFERQLTADGVCVVKLWVSLDVDHARRRVRRRLNEAARAPTLSEIALLASADHADRRLAQLREDSGDWVTLDGRHRERSAKAAIAAVLKAIKRFHQAPLQPPAVRRLTVRRNTPRLADVDLSAQVPKAEAARQLTALQRQLARQVWAAHAARRAVVVVLEGWDAAGKGGVIRRVTDALDARLFQVVPIAAPTDEERQHPYLWRFWRHVPRDGQMTVFDRSWYGRVLVERVEQLASPSQWRRAYGEINAFEAQLVERGAVLVKCWLHLSPEEQLRRFQSRAETPHKQHKLTAEDWRNREKWTDYADAADTMFAQTDRPGAPWTLVAAEDKHHARLTVLKTLCDALAAH
ncbi:hypothetical protein JN531_003130 [Flagellatimonas centrodinii]|uniref:hypothetical protein n=1 Tax=Flagellatimonas centrodinii TaxID=2806210 RepID=UPI001FEF0B4F|nr:hypothetical protein [Flagellatimonas centrodinii]ULQ47285.1 hypothetical protein JN531_003130 [Flagellatimonas centrodinii]